MLELILLLLDTSFVGQLFDIDDPQRTQDTWTAWNEIKNSRKYKIILSEVLFDEVDKCHEPKRSDIFAEIETTEYNFSTFSEEIDKIACMIIDLGILTQKDFNDCVMIATAMVEGCDLLLSWDKKHIVQSRTQEAINKLAKELGYKPIKFLTATDFIYRRK